MIRLRREYKCVWQKGRDYLNWYGKKDTSGIDLGIPDRRVSRGKHEIRDCFPGGQWYNKSITPTKYFLQEVFL